MLFSSSPVQFTIPGNDAVVSTISGVYQIEMIKLQIIKLYIDDVNFYKKKNES